MASDYEGLLSSEIKALNSTWSIWNDGCPGGESVEQMQARVDSIIAQVREYHRQYKEEGLHTRDVVIVAHGHFSRVLISRWINFPLCLGTHFNVEPGGVAYLGYNHNSLKEPALNALNLYATVN
ncbi:histidine phosphatase superfamily [Mycena haematopus]|nr:histidine phosphatase superfamily [Mycena haematopus]